VKGPVPHRCGALVVGGPYPRERIVAGDLAAILERSGSVIDSGENSDDRGTVNLLDGLRDAIEKDLWMLHAWNQEAKHAWS